MTETQLMQLRLSPARLADFCRQLRQRTRDPALTLQLLTTLQSFLSICVEDRNQPALRLACSDLEAQIEEVRAALLARHAAQIGPALQQRDTAAIVHSFTTLSRSGFAHAAASAWSALTAQTRSASLNWLNEWTRDARQRAETAGRYPDAPDFRAADIAVETYLALQELREILLASSTAAE